MFMINLKLLKKRRRRRELNGKVVLSLHQYNYKFWFFCYKGPRRIRATEFNFIFTKGGLVGDCSHFIKLYGKSLIT